MSVGKVCIRTVVTARPEESAAAVAKRMQQYEVGALVVMQDERPIGIVTDRDLVLRVMAVGKEPNATDVRSIMTDKLVCAPEQMPLEDAMNLMRGYQIRRLVVTNTVGELAGIFTLDDMLELLGEEQTAIAGLLRTLRGRRG